MFPSDWGDHLSHHKKKQKTYVDSVCSTDLQHVEILSDIKQKIERTVFHAEFMQNIPELQIEYILSKVPYIQMLENIYGSDKRTIPNIPILTKFYEESLMRQPTAQEQPCVMENMCEARMIDKTSPFTCVELRLPDDPPTPQMCVLCSRCTTQKMFYDMCYLKKDIPCLIQRYGNIFGQKGEYSTELMLTCPSTMSQQVLPLPIMTYQRNFFSVIIKGGVKYLKQERVSHEDFQPPSDSARL
jgi:hypothetical protein